ncbi:MAG: flavohemoglobin expression-modulating QEGLA motif protein, partial [Arenimonas sp.]
VKHHAGLDKRMEKAVRGIRLLESVSWHQDVQQQFLIDWRSGKKKLPQVVYRGEQHGATRDELRSIAEASDVGHPLGRYVQRTANSWINATHLLEALGTPAVTDYSIQLFGRPGDALPGNGPSNIVAAQHFIFLANELDSELGQIEAEYCLSAETVQSELQEALNRFFIHHKVNVELDPNLIAKAAAGPTRIRLRANTSFSEYDRHQLLEHEAFVHSLTALNGREQPYFKSLARNSPRITATQEGMATFAELITGAIDIERLKRISLRILAIDKAMQGADFLEVFQFFLEAGQSDTDSFSSTQRVFRGVPITGGCAFTKDTVYLHGLLSVHTFFRWCLRHRRLRLTRLLFAGKMSLQDIFDLEPMFDDGVLREALYLPPWIQRANGLAGMLAFSLFANKIKLDTVDADDLVLGL